jgi:anti-sigma B factor antagonist
VPLGGVIVPDRTFPVRPLPSVDAQHHKVRIDSRDVGERTTVIELTGELDLAAVALLNAVVDHHLARGRRFLRFDVSALEFCDCAVLGALVRAHHEALDRRGTAVLVGVSPQLSRLVRVAHLHDTLLLADGTDDPPRPRRARPNGSSVPFGRPPRRSVVQTALLPSVAAAHTADGTDT